MLKDYMQAFGGIPGRHRELVIVHNGTIIGTILKKDGAAHYHGHCVYSKLLGKRFPTLTMS